MVISPGRWVFRPLTSCHRPWPGCRARTNPPIGRARPGRSRIAAPPYSPRAVSLAGHRPSAASDSTRQRSSAPPPWRFPSPSAGGDLGGQVGVMREGDNPAGLTVVGDVAAGGPAFHGHLDKGSGDRGISPRPHPAAAATAGPSAPRQSPLILDPPDRRLTGPTTARGRESTGPEERPPLDPTAASRMGPGTCGVMVSLGIVRR